MQLVLMTGNTHNGIRSYEGCHAVGMPGRYAERRGAIRIA